MRKLHFRSTRLILLAIARLFSTRDHMSGASRTKWLPALTALLALLGVSASPALAATFTQDGSTLTIDLGPGVQSAKVFVDNGSVSGDVEGQAFGPFNGVTDLVVQTGGGEDKLEVEAVSSGQDLSITADASLIFSQIEVGIKAIMDNALLTTALEGSGGEDKLKVEAELDNADLTVIANTGGGEDSLEIKAKHLSGGSATDMFDLDLSGSEDQTKIEIESEAGSLTTAFDIDTGASEDTTEVKIVSTSAVALSGSVDTDGGTFGDGNKVSLEVDSPEANVSSFRISSGRGRDELLVLFNGPLDITETLVLEGGAFMGGITSRDQDKLLVLAEGGLTEGSAGKVTLDGGPAFDECEAFPDANFTDCEIIKP